MFCFQIQLAPLQPGGDADADADDGDGDTTAAPAARLLLTMFASAGSKRGGAPAAGAYTYSLISSI